MRPAKVVPLKGTLDEPLMDFPNRLRELRLAAGLTLDAVAQRVNMTLQNVGKLERGTLQLKVADLPKFAHALACEPEEILPESLRLDPKLREVIARLEALPEVDRNRLLHMIEAYTDNGGDDDEGPESNPLMRRGQQQKAS